MPVVSVVMIFHRVTPFLPLALRSVLEQTFRDLELVLVDNGTGVDIRTLTADPRVRCVALPENRGIAAGNNAGFAGAKGEFLALLDSDDIALPRRLERQVAALRGDPKLGLVSSRAEQIDANGTVIGNEFALLEADAQRTFTAYSNPAPAPSFTGRTELFHRFAWRPEVGIAADYDFFSRAAEVVAMRGLPEVLMQYRCHPGQVTSSRQNEQALSACVARWLTARRRAGRGEDFDATIARVRGWAAAPRSLEEIYRQFSRWCLDDDLPRLAVYHARKMVSARASSANVALAMKTFGRALRAERRDRASLVRLFFRGPLRAHGLQRA